ncbi:Neurabin-1 [Schistosoma japonicum]|nr:Neurabin-1 [Schistosoma japonicum]
MNMSVLSDTLHTANRNEDSVSKEDVCPRRLSRVSRLRDMFQTGVVKPIDDTEDGFNVESTVFSECNRPEPERFSRAFPGSPPMKTLRHHRTSLNKSESTQQSMTSSTSVDGAFCLPGPRSPLKSPPTRPPKPRHLSFPKPTVLEEVKLKPVPPKTTAEYSSYNNDNTEPVKIPNYPVTYVGHNSDNQALTTKVNGNLADSSTSQNSTPVTIIKTTPLQTSKNPVEFHRQSYEVTTQPSGDSDSLSTQFICDSTTGNHCERPKSSDIQDFVLRPDAFHMSSFPEIDCKDSINGLSVLQHAEPVAVNTADDDDGLGGKIDDTENSFEIVIGSTQCNTSFSPLITLPVPKGLNVVAVDDDGVHIFEDGNFLYALPGLNDKYSDDSDFYDSREDVTNVSDLIPSYTGERVNEDVDDKTNIDKILSVSSSSNSSKSTIASKLANKRSGSSDSLVKQPRVRFSSEPILVFSTHSTTDYNRRNEEIDPLSASAEYELEKHLEDMDLFEIDFCKGVNGLGISIVGSGVDTSSGEQKLSIFIKSLTPGGAAEADGRIQVYDQIVQVDGHSLVGVSQQFAAQVLQSTGDIIHFVLARDKDPPNSRIAKILTEKQEEENEETEEAENESKSNKSPDKNQEVVSTQTDNPVNLSGGDSTEALHNLIAVATRTMKQAKRWSDDDDDDDSAAVDENGVDCEIESSCEKYFNNNNDTNDTSSVNSLFQQFKKSNCGNIKSLNGYSTPSNYQHSSPRSALKGTATAASTRRRNEAIMEYIHQAVLIQDNVCLPSNLVEKGVTDKNTNSNLSTIDFVTTVSWALASELHDCRIQLKKFHSRVRNLEQRLTAQEAAADEAIERLCLRCRHLELELKQSQPKCSPMMMLSQQNISNSVNYSPGASNTCNPIYCPVSAYNIQTTLVLYLFSTDYSFCGILLFYFKLCMPRPAKKMMDYCLAKMPVGFVVCLSIITHTLVIFKANASAEKFTGLTDTDESIVSIPTCVNVKASVFEHSPSYNQDKVEVNNDANDSSPVHIAHDSYSTTVELPLFIRQLEDRTRLVNTGGLAGRRPPTKIVIHFFLDLSNYRIQPQVPSVANPFNSDNYDSYSNSSPNFMLNMSRPPRPVPSHSNMFHCSPLNDKWSSSLQSKLLTTNPVDSEVNSTQITPSRKPIGGYQLPGLAVNSFSTPVLRRTNICTDLSKPSNTHESDSSTTCSLFIYSKVVKKLRLMSNFQSALIYLITIQ